MTLLIQMALALGGVFLEYNTALFTGAQGVGIAALVLFAWSVIEESQ